MVWWYIFVVLITSILPVSAAIQDHSIITQGKSISIGGQTIVSSGGNFSLGFFSPGNSSNSYLGIWNNTIPKQTVIWVANRESPILKNSNNYSTAVFMLGRDGNLVLLNGNGKVIWSSNVGVDDSYVNSTFGVLLDNGNLVLRRNGNEETELWQSIDHPTDTLMPVDNVGTGHSTCIKVFAATTVSIGLLLISVTSYVLWRKKLRKKGRIKGNMQEVNSMSITYEVEQRDTELVSYNLLSLLASTDNFSEANKLGEGGFGPVYKGSLPEFPRVAMKRLSKKSLQGAEEFMNELKLIAKLQHKNLVRILGCCFEGDEKILIYEYMPNRSLDKFIFNSSEQTKLDWSKRFRIIEGITQGLLYLHKYSRLKVIHRDLKASNVLLDESMNPKISDFGMARIVNINQTEANTNRVVGTYGYMSPEYALYGKFSEKSDVFSFGVLLLEIISGRRNTDFYNTIFLTLLGWAWTNWEASKGEELIDPSIRESCTIQEALKCINVGLLCVQEVPSDRPSMSRVAFMLSNEIASLPSPKQPAFSTRRRTSDTSGSSSQTINKFSNNEVTISMLEAR